MRGALNAAQAAGVDPRHITHAAGWTPERVQQDGWVPWDSFARFCDHCERSLHEVGALPRFGELLHQQLSAVSAVTGVLLSPVTLYRLYIEATARVHRNVQAIVHAADDHEIHLSLRLRAEDRDGSSFFRMAASALQFVPLHIGLPAATIQVETKEREARLVIELPEPAGLDERLRRGARVFNEATLHQLERLQPWISPLFERAPDSPDIYAEVPGETALDQRIKEARTRWSLTTRQARVLREIVLGSSNKEIATALACSDRTVESHVTQLLKKSRTSSRGQLISKFWTGSTDA